MDGNGLSFSDIGIAGLFIIMVLREVFTFVGRKRNSNNNGKMARQIADLHAWHDAKSPARIETMVGLLRSIQADLEKKDKP